MRWKDKPPPQVGDTRERFVYAWKKTRVRDYTVWLETYVVYETYLYVSQRDFMNGFYPRPGEQWVEISRNVCDYYV